MRNDATCVRAGLVSCVLWVAACVGAAAPRGAADPTPSAAPAPPQSSPSAASPVAPSASAPVTAPASSSDAGAGPSVAAPTDPASAADVPLSAVAAPTGARRVLHVSYGNLGTAAGSEWEVYDDGTVVGKVCYEPPAQRKVSAEDVEALHRAVRSCKLCDFAKLPPDGNNFYKQIYRVQASWPDATCEADVFVKSRFRYDARAKRCHAAIEAFVNAEVTMCPGALDTLEPAP